MHLDCKSVSKQYKLLLKKIHDNDIEKEVMHVLVENGLDNIHTMKAEKVLETYAFFKDKFEKIYLLV